MPMIGKKHFVREKPPKDLHPDEELFYCKTTHEVFRHYDAFFDRVILCNSLVWTCCLTGKNGLTYAEALESENNARKTLEKFPKILQKPILFLAKLTNRGRLNDMCDDIFNFVKDRYFVGETVEVSLNGIKKRCEVKRVISPPEKEIKTAKSESKKKTPVKIPSPEKIKYEIEEKEQGRKIIVQSKCVNRPKGVYTKPHNKLFIKHHSEPENGIWKVKENVVEKFDLDNFNMRSAFSGPLPKYTKSPTKKKTPSPPEPEKSFEKKKSTELSGKKTIQGKLSFKKETEEEKRKTLEREQEEFVKHRMLLEEERQKRKEELRKQVEDEKEKLKEQKLKEREQKKEEKKKMAEYLNSWKKPRDDLECDDLTDLPKPTPIDCNIPHECFGDAVMVLEFITAFKDLINLKDTFPQGLTFENLERALLESDIQGYLNDLTQMLLTAVFQLQDWEDEKVSDSSKPGNIPEFKDQANLTPEQAMTVASTVATWPQSYHGTILRNMPLDSFSVTEILRLHILASGSDTNRAAQISLTGISEDPGLYFKIEEPELIKKLETTSIFQLSCEERLKILNLLTHQIASCSTLRNLVDDNLTKSRPLRYELRHLRWAYNRQKKENALSNVKKKLETNEDGKGVEAAGDKTADDKAAGDKAAVEKTEEVPDNTVTLTAEEKAAEEEKRYKEEAKRKNEFLRKERELITQIQKLQSAYQVTPLGRDRAYRRFWTFQSIPCIFVEDDDKQVGKCLLKETPLPRPNAAVNRSEASANNIRKYLQQLDSTKNGSSDKENDILQDLAIIQSDMSVPLKDRKLWDLNPRVDFKKGADNCFLCKEEKSEFQSSIPSYCPHGKNNSVMFGLCTANMETCPVHNINAPRTTWSFFYKEEDLDSLLLSLNKRGFREGPLREAILSEKESIKESMARCQTNSLNKNLPISILPEVRKSQRHQYSRESDFSKMKPLEALELTLRDMILEFEHRIYAGGLGSIKISNRIQWREAIEQSTYDMQSDYVHVGSRTLSIIKGANTEYQVVKDMACALLQVSQGIEAKFLHPPLGDSDIAKQQKEKAQKCAAFFESRQKTKDLENESEPDPASKSPSRRLALERWQTSLMECTSLSQLFVHLGTLERSVAWSRSVLKAHCRICRRRGDGENMLLCDGCNRGHHLYCLKPPLEEIPQGDWFCLSCKPPEKTTPQKKKQYVECSDSESESEDSDEESEEEEEEESEEEEENTTNQSVEPIFIEVCEECGVGGTVICCDGCPAVYHPECIGLRRIPRGEWLCKKCTKHEVMLKKGQKPSPTGSVTRAQALYISHSKAKKKAGSLRTKIQIKRTTKRQRQESTDSESVTPKRSKMDSASNTSRRRSKSAIGDDDGDVLDYKTCLDLLDELMHHPSSWPFMAPVSKKDAPEYHNIIKRPMDFGTIRSKLHNMSYKANEEFILDLFLVLENCEIFNPKYSIEYKAGKQLRKEVKRLLRQSPLANCISATVRTTLLNDVSI